MPSFSKVIVFRHQLRKMPPPQATAGENKTQGLILTVL